MEKYDYCTLSPDKVFGVYIGSCCKKHDINYSTNGKIKIRKQADKLLKKEIILKFKENHKKYLGFIIGNIYYLFSRLFGKFYWKKWSLNGVQKYKKEV